MSCELRVVGCQLLNKKIGWQLTNNKVLFLSLKTGLLKTQVRFKAEEPFLLEEPQEWFFLFFFDRS